MGKNHNGAKAERVNAYLSDFVTVRTRVEEIYIILVLSRCVIKALFTAEKDKCLLDCLLSLILV